MGRELALETRHALAHWTAGTVLTTNSDRQVLVRVTAPFAADVRVVRDELWQLLVQGHVAVRRDEAGHAAIRDGEWVTGRLSEYNNIKSGEDFRRTAKQQRYKKQVIKMERDGIMPCTRYLHDVRLRQSTNTYENWRDWCERMEAGAVPIATPSLDDLQHALRATMWSTPAPSWIRWALATHQLQLSEDRRQLEYRDPADAGTEAIDLARDLFAAVTNPAFAVHLHYPTVDTFGRRYWKFQPQTLLQHVTREQLALSARGDGWRLTWDGPELHWEALDENTSDPTLRDAARAQVLEAGLCLQD